ncbi:hypothetical protein [Stutzerimonas nitrititolerans]|uniref:hypothetical protein n=1 Tax=Stutzerimonas nitrititolerans TaxID=2482751 RepID=UPI00289C9816|nr:hypothetical protein [Stutzerimonas nitrititolerans]
MPEVYYKAALEKKYKGQYGEVVECLARYLLLASADDPLFKEAFYLKMEALRFLGRHKESRIMLDDMPFQDHSFSYLKAIRKAVDSEGYISWFFSKILKYKQDTGDVENSLFNYAVLMRDLGRGEDCVSYIRDRLLYTLGKYAFGSFSRKSESKVWSAQAEVALADLKIALDAEGIEFFLKGGVLLGCIREGRILEHDYDIDVGVDERFDRGLVENALSKSGKFCFRENDNERTIYVTHANGVLVDVFIHYLDEGLYKNKGMYLTWKNRPFRLVEKEFLNEKYLIPDDFDTYLTETYGDWRKPAPNYNTYTDNLNTEINDPYCMSFYFLSKMAACYIKGDGGRMIKILKAYVALSHDYDILKFIESRLGGVVSFDFKVGGDIHDLDVVT